MSETQMLLNVHSIPFCIHSVHSIPICLSFCSIKIILLSFYSFNSNLVVFSTTHSVIVRTTLSLIDAQNIYNTGYRCHNQNRYNHSTQIAILHVCLTAICQVFTQSFLDSKRRNRHRRGKVNHDESQEAYITNISQDVDGTNNIILHVSTHNSSQHLSTAGRHLS